jgi:hypothetical protein
VGKGADVPIEEADLVLPLVNPREVATGAHQPQQKQPRLPPDPGDVDQHLEEVDLREVAGPVRQRDEDLSPLPAPLGHRRLHQGDPDRVALLDEQRVQPGRRQLLFAPGPTGGLGQQRLDPDRDPVPRRPGARLRLAPHR